MKNIKKSETIKNIAGYLNAYISALSFWGTFLLFFLVIGVGMNKNDIMSIFFSFYKPLKLLMVYLLSSLPISLIMVSANIILLKRNYTMKKIAGTYLYELLSIPYNGFNFRKLFDMNKDKYQTKLSIIKLSKTLIWWGIIFVTVKIIYSDNNSILTRINKCDMFGLSIRILGIVSTVTVLNILGYIINRKS